MRAVESTSASNAPMFPVPAPDTELPDMQFLRAVADEFADSFRLAVLGGVDQGHSLVDRMINKFKYWLTCTVFYDREKWGNNLRVINTLRTLIDDGFLYSESWDELYLLYVAKDGFTSCTGALEHYVENGDLLEIMKRAQVAEQVEEEDSTLHLKVRLLRLYSYDMRREQEHAESGSPEEMFQVPLEIRMSFCGFDDAITFNERNWGFKNSLNHDFSDEQVLSSFRKQTDPR